LSRRNPALVRPQPPPTPPAPTTSLSRESWPNRKTGDAWKKKGLDFFDFFTMVKPCWAKGFDFVTNMEGWKRCGLRPFTACVYWSLLAEEARAAELMEGLLATLPDLDRETVRLLNAQSVMPAADAEEDEGDLDSAVGFTGQQQDDAIKINAKRLQLAEELVTFLKAHPAGVNTDFKDAYASHFAAMKKVLAPKIIYRVVTASEQWGKGNLGNKSAAEKARLAFEEKEAKLIQWVEKDAAAVQKAAATRREYARVAPWCVRLLMQQGGTSVDDVCEALKDDEVKALLHHMGELTFAPGKAIERCKQLADLVSRVDLPPLASLPPLTDSEIKALGRKKAASDKKKAKAAKTKTTEATSQQVPPPAFAQQHGAVDGPRVRRRRRVFPLLLARANRRHGPQARAVAQP
jgi:hypothetical protein